MEKVGQEDDDPPYDGNVIPAVAGIQGLLHRRSACIQSPWL